MRPEQPKSSAQPRDNSSSDSGRHSDPLAGSFLQHLAAERSASVYTQRNYAQALREFTDWHTKERQQAPPWPTLNRDDFRSYLRYLGRHNLGRAAIQLRFSALRSFYKFLARGGHVESSPIQSIQLPKLGKRLPRFLTAQQMQELLEAPLRALAPPDAPGSNAAANFICFRDAAVLETIYSGGLRISEACGVRAEDIDWSSALLRIRGKGKKERLAPVGKAALDAIRRLWKVLPSEPRGTCFAFPAGPEKGTPVSPRVVQLRLKRYLAMAALDPELTPHKIRHSYATHMLDAGADLRSVQELLGHAHLATTQVYTHVTTERLKQAYDDAHPRA